CTRGTVMSLDVW
nr:immunoglobulin heavy chain junction region [Macaca mulatta]MPN84533.1 immunoglobulin heavy chain junction region [Macaca mulatta]MPN84665.1 immunoglobulin heavy chain junction region [Macaca mulatta]MPN84725.1 immunoglobulin heavy chain junction region [Macaca mulatta]